MWEKLNKEETNNKFQLIKTTKYELGKCITVKNNESKEILMIEQEANRTYNAIFWRLGLILCVCVVFIFISMTCISRMWKINSSTHKSLWRTSAHVHVYTYTHLKRISTQRASDLDDPDLQPDKVVSCYYNLPRESEPHQLMPHNIHPYLCTHINAAFAQVVNKKVSLADNQYESLRDVVKLKRANPKLKVLLSIGGSGNSGGFSDMVVDHASRKVFIKSIKEILRNYTLDGVDLDWEFPALHRMEVGGRERQHFSQLLREIRMEYIREKKDYILTIAAAAPETIVNISYDIDQVNQYVDFVNIMSYDYHFYTKYTPFTGFNSPLYPRTTERMYLATLNINYTVNMYIGKGLDRNKIVVGIPTYGHTFTLVNANNPRVGSPASGFGALGGSGFVNYPDVCAFLKNYSDAVIKRDDDAKVPYLYKNKEWVSYDTPQSVMEKAKFIKENRLRGAMIYSLNADDYEGICNTGLQGFTRFPLSESVKNTLIFNSTESSELNILGD